MSLQEYVQVSKGDNQQRTNLHQFKNFISTQINIWWSSFKKITQVQRYKVGKHSEHQALPETSITQ